jgi:hypothetical protein
MSTSTDFDEKLISESSHWKGPNPSHPNPKFIIPENCDTKHAKL